MHQWWINNASLGLRNKVLNRIGTAEGMVFNGMNLRFDFIDFVSQLSQPDDINQLIKESLNLLLSVDVNDSVRQELKKILLSGQTAEKYWTTAWNEYAGAKDREESRSVINTRLELFFKKIFSLLNFK